MKITRILNPTSIDLGEYVINPYLGCEYSCLYCYVRSNRVMAKKKKKWGEFIEAKKGFDIYTHSFGGFFENTYTLKNE